MSEQKLNALQQAMLAKSGKEIAVKAEDLQEEGKDWSLTFFEPQYGESYTLKFLMNLSPMDNLVHRKVYKNLPDPKRKGKNFHYISSGKADTCEVLDLFFELYEAKKGGDLLAEQKLKNYMGVTNQACSVVQIISSSKPEDVGKVRLFTFSTYGPTATIANLVNEKLNPTKQQIENGFIKEEIFDLTPTSVLLLSCEEKDYDGVKGRDFTKSSWGRKEFGMQIFDESGKNIVYEFKKGDINEDMSFSPEAEPQFEKAMALLMDPNIDMLNNYAYKTPTTDGLTDEVKKYVTQTWEKVKMVVPIIRDAKNIAEIEKSFAGAEGDGGSDAEMIGGKTKTDILSESIPELDGAVNTQHTEEATKAPDSVEDILGGIGKS